MAKEYDWIAAQLDNPGESNTVFKAAGLNTSNTEIKKADVYKNNAEIQNDQRFQTNGKFDEAKFDEFYKDALKSYNDLSRDTYSQDVAGSKIFDIHNVWAPVDKIKNTIEVEYKQNNNPLHISKGLVGFNEEGPQTKTEMELAESQKVLANPIEVSKGAAPIWEDSPETDFWSNIGKTRVLAQWEFDADELGNPTNDPSKIVYQKGSYKTNEDGEFYLENLEGRSPYGKQVLSLSNVITAEDSPWNKYDFFDADDLKSNVPKTLVKTLVQIAPLMFSVTAPYYAAATIGLSMSELGVVLGKMAIGSENATLNNIGGFFDTLKNTGSREAQEHIFSMENMIRTAGDLYSFLSSQQYLARYAPAMFGNKASILSETEREASIAAKTKQLAESEVKRLSKISFKNEGEAARALSIVNANARSDAEHWMSNLIKDSQKTGELVSKATMALSFGAGMYGEAKAQGLSDNQATAVTLGYMAGQWGLLNTHIGSYIFEGKKIDTIEKQRLIQSVFKDNKIYTEGLKEASSNANKEAKFKMFSKFFNTGKQLALKVYTPGKTAVEATLSGAFAGGVEMVGFEVLHDLTTSTYNLYNWMVGEDSRMESFDNIKERYANAFIGGAMGGFIFAPKVNWVSAKALQELTPEQARQRLVFLGRHGELDKIRRVADKYKKNLFGDSELSYKEHSFSEEGPVYEEASQTNKSQNDTNYSLFNKWLDDIEGILNAEGLKISDNMVISKNLLSDLRFNALSTSDTLGGVLQDFNTLVSDLVDLRYKLKEKNSTLTKMREGRPDTVSGSENRKEQVLEHKGTSEDLKKALKSQENAELEISKIEKQINEKRKQINDIIEGKRAPYYIKSSLFEMTGALSEDYKLFNFNTYVEETTGKAINEFSDEALKTLRTKYNAWAEANKRDVVYKAFANFEMGNEYASKLFTKYFDRYLHPNDYEERIMNQISYQYKNLIEDSNIERFLNSFKFLLDNKTVEASNVELELDPEIRQAAAHLRIVRDNLLENPLNLQVLEEEPVGLEKGTLATLRNDIIKYQEIPEGASADDIEQILYVNQSLMPIDSSIIKNTAEAISADDSKRIDFNNNLHQAIQENLTSIQADIRRKFDDAINTFQLESIAGNFAKRVEDLINNEYVNTEVLDTLIQASKAAESIIEGSIDSIEQYAHYLGEQITSVSEATRRELANGFYVDGAPGLINVYRSPEEYLKIRNSLKGLTQKLEALRDSSPILDMATEFIKHLSVAKIDLKEELNLTDNILNKLNDISEYKIDEKGRINLDTMITGLKLFRTAFRAAEAAEPTIDNLFGYNVTANELTGSKLPIISTETRIAAERDINTYIDKLELIKKLVDSNIEKTAKEQDRVSVQREYASYNSVINTFLPNIPSDWNGVEELKNTLESLTTIKELYNSKQQDLDPDKRLALSKDYIAMGDAIYKFRIANEDKFKSPDEIAKLFTIGLKNKTFDISGMFSVISKVTEMTRETKSFDDDTLFGQLVTWMGIRPSDYYNEYVKSISNDLAPIPTQDMAAYTAYVNYKAGKFVDTVIEGLQKSFYNFYKYAFDNYKAEEVSGFGIKYPEEAVLTESYKKYKGAVFVEGKPGAGKTFSVFKTNSRMVQDEAKSVWVVSPKKGTAEDLIKGFGLKAENVEKFKAFDRKELMTTLFTDWTDHVINGVAHPKEGIDYDVNPDSPELSLKWKPSPLSEVPDLILIDECTQYSELDLLGIMTLRERYGTAITLAGDSKQAGVTGNIKYKYKDHEIDFNMGIARKQYLRTPRMGTTIRTDNIHQDENTTLLELLMPKLITEEEHPVESATFKYYLDDNKLNGTIVTNINEDPATIATKYPGKPSKVESRRDADKAIEVMMANVKVDPTTNTDTRVGYIYDSEESPMYKLIKEKYSDKVKFYKNNWAAGLESDYFIIDLNKLTIDSEDLLNSRSNLYKGLYTGLTRARKGSLLLINKDFKSPDYEEIYFDSNRVATTQPKIFPKKDIEDYAVRRTEILTKSISEPKPIEDGRREKKVLTGAPLITSEIEIVEKTPEVQFLEVDGETETLFGNGLFNEEELKTAVELNNEVNTRASTAESTVDLDDIPNTPESFGSGIFNTMVYTNPVHELGLVSDAKGYKFGKYSNNRIDNIHGLINVGVLKNITTDSEGYITGGEFRGRKYNIGTELIKDVQKTLDYLKHLIIDAPDRATLLNDIKRYLGIKGNVTDQFAYHAVSGTYGFMNDSKNAAFRIFYKDLESELQYDHHGKDNKTKESSKHEYTYIINVDGVNQLEIPWINVPNWKTVMRSMGNSKIDALLGKHKGADDYNDRMALFRDIQNIIFRTDNSWKNYQPSEIVALKAVHNLMSLFTATNCLEVYLDDALGHDWVPSKTFESFGPIKTKDAGTKFYDRYGYEYEAQWMSLHDYANSTSKYVSKVYMSAEDIYQNGTSRKKFLKGIPYVLVGDSGFKNDDEIIFQFKKQLNDPNERKRVSIQYLIPPGTDLKEFTGYIKAILNKEKPDIRVGNTLTGYRILSNILNSGSEGFFNTILNTLNSEQKLRAETAVRMVKDLSDAEEAIRKDKADLPPMKLRSELNSMLVNRLNKKVESSTLFREIYNVLNIVFNKEYNNGIISGSSSEIENAFTQLYGDAMGNLTQINYNIAFKPNENLMGKFIIPVNSLDTSGKRLVVNGVPKDFFINGKIDSAEMFGDILPLTDATLIKFASNSKTNMMDSLDNDLYKNRALPKKVTQPINNTIEFKSTSKNNGVSLEDRNSLISTISSINPEMPDSVIQNEANSRGLIHIKDADGHFIWKTPNGESITNITSETGVTINIADISKTPDIKKDDNYSIIVTTTSGDKFNIIIDPKTKEAEYTKLNNVPKESGFNPEESYKSTFGTNSLDQELVQLVADWSMADDSIKAIFTENTPINKLLGDLKSSGATKDTISGIREDIELSKEFIENNIDISLDKLKALEEAFEKTISETEKECNKFLSL